MDVREKSSNEKRLIDVNDIYSLFNQNGIARLHVSDIDTIPRVDAVEVVRCRECKHRKDTYVKEHAHCSLTGYTVEYDDFCSRGERKEGDD